MGGLTLYIDGASRKNPGPSALGVHIVDESGNTVDEYAEYIGETTNNVAEYTALIRGLERARRLGATRLQVLSDSQLVVRQLSGEYRVRSLQLKGLHIAARRLLKTFNKVAIEHVPRDKNTRADELANEILDQQGK